jgi:hypothetical protein
MIIQCPEKEDKYELHLFNDNYFNFIFQIFQISLYFNGLLNKKNN